MTDQEFYDEFVVKMKILSEVQTQMDKEEKSYQKKEKEGLTSKIQAK